MTIYAYSIIHILKMPYLISEIYENNESHIMLLIHVNELKILNHIYKKR
jgi:hypothetical protein